jgi:hypothetical protein
MLTPLPGEAGPPATRFGAAQERADQEVAKDGWIDDFEAQRRPRPDSSVAT